MKIILLSKRYPQKKDLWQRPAGRFYHLAKYLASFGHTVDFVIFGYQRDQEFIEYRDGITWHAVSLMPNPLHFYTYTSALAKQKKPDWIIGFSDTYFGILAVFLAAKNNALSLVDAYDNYESYIPWCKPLHYLWRYALKQADCVSAPGEHLLRKMDMGREGHKLHCLLPMAADDQFKPVAKAEARKALDLPLDKKLIGYCGSAHETRDMAVFFQAIDILSKRHSDYVFVMTGFVADNITLPSSVKHLGYIADELMPTMIGSLDVMVSACTDSAFGNYSYPVKIYEALASGTKVVASDTASIAEILSEDRDCLFPVGDATALADKIEMALSADNTARILHKESWQEVALKLNDCLLNAHR